MISKASFSLRNDVMQRGKGYVDTEKVLERQELTAQELWPQIAELLSDGLIEPTRSAMTLYAGTPPLLSKYRIVPVDLEPYDATGLSPRIAQATWLTRHPDKAREVDDFLKRVSLALEGELDTSGLDKREAGYVLALDEHAFDGTTKFTRALHALRIDLAELGVADVPWPPTMETYGHGNGFVVVSENVAPYNRLRRIARDPDAAARAFGFAPTAVVFGNGNLAARPGFVADVLEQAQLPAGSKLLYWGDLDQAGIKILCQLFEDATADVMAWKASYHAMLEAARRRMPRESRDRRGIPIDLTPLREVLSTEDFSLASRLIDRGYIVPQEALSPSAYEDGSLSC